jgi:hypothetical protein
MQHNHLRSARQGLLSLLVLALPLLSSCTRNPGTVARVSTAEAETLVREVLLDANPDLNPGLQMTLEETTTDEIWERLGIQTFRRPDEFESYAIDRGQASALGIAFGGFGVTQMHVTDLDADGHRELTYAYSWGSGLHRSHVAVYLPAATPPRSIDAGVILLDGDFALEKIDDRTVRVRAGFYDWEQGEVVAEAPVGRLALDRTASEPVLRIQLDDALPEEITRRLWTP